MDPLEGKTGTDKRTGQRVVRQGGRWVPLGKQQPMEASMRSRMDIGMAPMMQAQQDMASAEKGGVNPLNRDWGAAVLDSVDIPIPFTSGAGGQSVRWSPFDPAAKAVGGQDYQDYTQASKAFEAQLMPIMSGAAVSPSEAQRQIKAALPELGDSPATLQKKARTRAMMLNGAAKARGLPLPYPDVPTWGVNTTQRPASSPGAPEAGGQGRVRTYNPKTGGFD
ncbi:hypothetical protein [Phenylobacterium deserti]|uniref:Uncharacterized protein n=1 Tax=Phenylobacterium deserti TaxID=1914756 RepID=A0A328ABW1_9CAUL|nr:hypothetical protein [Phenylobacterium deserti]RAK52141.1 hypothetical protein DJ018_13375 [Phenylobacterium deserti]